MALDTEKLNETPPGGDGLGYNRPPIAGQFKPGQSGNAKGRPKGRPNVATLVKTLFNEPVSVRQGGVVRRMPAGEAIVRAQVAQAAAGDPKALSTVLEIMEMTGRTKEISDEEREKRSLHLRDPFSVEEYDLLRSLGREKQRERCRLIAESNLKKFATSQDGIVAAVVPPAIQAGDKHAAKNYCDEALQAYRQEIAACKEELVADAGNQEAQERFRRAVARIGLLADDLLFAGQFARAIAVADEALIEGTSTYWVPKTLPFYENFILTGMNWIRAIRAHASMLSERVDDARKFYSSFNSNKRIIETSWETSILRDFVSLRKAGYSHRLMEEIEKRYGDEGWTTGTRNIQQSPPKMKGEDMAFIHQNPDSLKSGDLLRDFGQVDEAMEVYLRNLKKWATNVAKHPTRADWKHNITDAVDRVALTTMQLFRGGRFYTALECTDKAAAIAADEFVLQALSACALMMIQGRTDEARTLFLRYRGEFANATAWEAIVAEQFAELRKIGCERPLMEEIEKRFAGIAVAGIADIPHINVKVSDAILIQASDLRSGELLDEREMLEEAFAVYRRCLHVCNEKIAKIAKGQINMQAITDREAAIDRLGQLSKRFLVDRTPAQALEVIESALAVRSNAKLNIYRAHVLMFLNHVDEARTLYLRYAEDKVDQDWLGKHLILDDFGAMRGLGLVHPLQDEIQTCLQPSEAVNTT